MNTGKQLILVKHSNPEIMPNIRAREWNLSNKGRRRAKKLAERLVENHPEVIFSSVEPKAQQTAEILAENLDVKFMVVDGLREHDRGGVPFYLEDEFHSLVQELFRKPDALIFGNETANQALLRFRKSLESILESHNNKNMVIVSHGTVISLFASWLTGADGYHLWRELGLPSFVVLDVENKKLLDTVNI